MLSVIVVTARSGGIDALIAGLSEQSFGAFELLLIDELYPRTGGYVVPIVGRRTYHDAPVPRWPRWGNYMRSLNEALKHARGDRLVFWSDYTCPHPETLATHAAFHEQHPDDV